jgi:hypothetical protein
LGPRRGRRLGQLCRHDTQTAKGDPSSDPHQITLNPEDTAFDIVGISNCTGFDAGVPLRDVQEAASHADPRTTMRYDRARVSLDRHATYIVAAFLAGAAR